MLEINVDRTGDYTVCRPAGELDAFTVGQFRESLTELSGEPRLLIDLSGVPFLADDVHDLDTLARVGDHLFERVAPAARR